MAFSTLTVSKLKAPTHGRREILDGQVPGFGVRVTERGVKSWFFVYRSPTKHGKRRRITIGRIGEIDLETARERARQLRAQLRAGQEPIVRTPAATGTLFRDVVEVFTKRALANMRSGREVRAIIDRELMRAWGDRPIASITRRDILEMVEARVDAGSPESARRLFEIVRRLFNWAISRDTFGIDRSPCDRLRPTDIIGKKPVRTRILTDNELRGLWAATEKVGYPFGPLLRLIALTGLRRKEAAWARWDELSLGGAIWTIPAERMKGQNGTAEAFVVPLTTDMLRVINGLPRIEGSPFLFTSNKLGNRPVSGFSAMKDRFDREMTGTATDWTIHDIRRTVRTHLSALRVPEMIKELILAHTMPGLKKVYDQWAYLDEKREALELWNARVKEIVG
jgi:integrase